MKVYLVYGDECDNVDFVFTSLALATEYSKTAHIEEREVYDSQPPTWSYWQRGAAVYPDGVVEDWTKRHEAKGEVSIPEVDDHLNQLENPWDGHTQSHCGEHVHVSGTNREAVEIAYQNAIERALARQDGKCKSTWPHRAPIDGVNVYETGFLSPPRASRIEQREHQT